MEEILRLNFLQISQCWENCLQSKYWQEINGIDKSEFREVVSINHNKCQI